MPDLFEIDAVEMYKYLKKRHVGDNKDRELVAVEVSPKNS